jgi:signal transduction histidine kinase
VSVLRVLRPGRLPGGRVPSPAPADAWLGGALAAVCVAGALALPARAGYRPADTLAVSLAAVSGLSLLWRRRAPLAVMTATGAVVVANAAAGYVIGFIQWPPWIALFTCFALAGRRTRVAAVVIAAAAVGGYLALNRGGVVASEAAGIAVTALVSAVAGDAVRSRRQRDAAQEARRLDEARREAMSAENVLLQERSRLARELHDSLGHTVNVMVLQAGVGRRVFADNPDYSREALECIATLGRGALDELDQVLRVLQPDERGAPSAPTTPSVADLEELVGRVRVAGREVDLHLDLGPDDIELTPSGARALYRIVQEALTNAVKHTSTGPIRVAVTGPATRSRPRCSTRRPGWPTRSRARARQHAGTGASRGGRLAAGRVDGGFRVQASIPVRARVPA